MMDRSANSAICAPLTVTGRVLPAPAMATAYSWPWSPMCCTRPSVHLSRASHLLYQQKAHVFKFFFFEISFCSVFSYSSKTDG